MKKNILIAFLMAVMVFSLAVPGFACHGGKCPLKGGWHGEGSKGKGQCPIAAKVMRKAHFFLENQKELGLKEDQVKAIKAIKMETMKAEIRQMAEMQVFQIDLKTKLSESPVDTEGLNGMIDAMAEGMKTSAKASVASYVKLKSILTDEQQSKMKAIWQQHEAAEHESQS